MDENPVAEWFGSPTYSGCTAALSSAMHFACPTCGADVVDVQLKMTNRRRHKAWHADTEGE